MVKIAVENPFTDIQQALQNKGYQVDMINQATEGIDYDILVVRDVERYDQLRFRGSLVETSGRTISDIVEEVEERLQRAGKIQGKPKAKATVATKVKVNSAKGVSGSRFTAGLLSGALIGSAAALLLAPKTGKEMQTVVKEKLPIGKSNDTSNGSGNGMMSQVKEKATDAAEQAKEKAANLKNQTKTDSDSNSNEQTNSSSEQTTASTFEEKPKNQ